MNRTRSVVGQYRSFMWVLAFVVAGFLTWLISTSTAGQEKDKDKDKDGEMEKIVAGLESNEEQTRDQSVVAILAQRKAVIERLIALIGAEGKRSDETRSAAAYVLGQLRAVEAVPALSKALANPPKERRLTTDITRYDAPIFTALVEIGRPAVPAMIENIEATDNAALVRNSLDVLCHVLGGKQHTLELLGKLKARPKDEKIVTRIEAAIEYTAKHYSGEDPLY